MTCADSIQPAPTPLTTRVVRAVTGSRAPDEVPTAFEAGAQAGDTACAGGRVCRGLSLAYSIGRQDRSSRALSPGLLHQGAPGERGETSALSQPDVGCPRGALPLQLRDSTGSDGLSAPRTGRCASAGQDVGRRCRGAAPERTSPRRAHAHLSGRTGAGIHRPCRDCATRS